jgi:putative chitobiose transport system permease protein
MSAALRHRAWTPAAFMAPALVVLGVFVLAALVQVVYASFTRSSAFGPAEWIGTANYRRLLASERFWICLANSGIYLLVTPVLIALSMGAALVVESGVRALRALRMVFFLPVVTPTIVAAVAWNAALREDGGVVNAALGLVGVGPVEWLTRYPWTLVSAMLVTLWKGFGFYMLIFAAGLLAVPKELKEAAALDGAGRWGVMRHVVLPAMRPTVALVFIVSSISALKVFEELYVTVKGAPIEHQTAVPLLFYEGFEARGDFGYASALGVTLFVIILALSLVNLRLSTRRGGGEPA